MAPEPEIALLLQQCRSGDYHQQIAALEQLVELRAYEAVSDIIELLTSPDAIIRSTAAEALGTLGDSELDRVGPALLRLLDDPDELARNAAAETLGALGYQPARDALEQALTVDPDWIVRASAAEGLGSLGDVQAVPILERTLDDEYEPVRSYAADAIGLLGSPDLVPWLGQRLRSEPEVEVKFALAGALYRLGSSEGLTWILALLKTADDDAALQCSTESKVSCTTDYRLLWPSMPKLWRRRYSLWHPDSLSLGGTSRTSFRGWDGSQAARRTVLTLSRRGECSPIPVSPPYVRRQGFTPGSR